MESSLRFNIRIYGMIINRNYEILIAEEFHYNTFMRKFPGGGLEYGESTINGLKREIREELSCEAEIIRHLHTTDIFISSAFRPGEQVIGVYYLLEIPEHFNEKYRDDFNKPDINGTENFKWVPLKLLTPQTMTLPADQRAVEVLKGEVIYFPEG